MAELLTYAIRLDEDAELEAMRVCTEALDSLDGDGQRSASAKRRAVRWLAEYYGVYAVSVPARAEEGSEP